MHIRELRFALAIALLVASVGGAAAAAFGIFMVGSTAGANSFLLLEDGSFLLLEDGSKLVLE